MSPQSEEMWQSHNTGPNYVNFSNVNGDIYFKVQLRKILISWDPAWPSVLQLEIMWCCTSNLKVWSWHSVHTSVIPHSRNTAMSSQPWRLHYPSCNFPAVEFCVLPALHDVAWSCSPPAVKKRRLHGPDELHTHRFSFVNLQTCTLLTTNHLRIFISHDSPQSHKKLYATFFIS